MRWVPPSALVLAAALTASVPPGPAAGQEKKGIEVKLSRLGAVTPADWKKEKPANLLRSYQFRLPEVKDLPGSEIVIFNESNPNPEKVFPTWKAQFIPPEGKTIDDVARTAKWDVKGATVSVLDVTGTWKYRERPKDPSSKEVLLENYRVVWVVVAEEGEAHHIRMSGPVGSVEAQYRAFEEWVKSLK